jgi:hypothetical protein
LSARFLPERAGSDIDISDISELWLWVQRVAGVLLVVCLCLYVLRCLVAAEFIGVDRFGHFLRGLLRYLVS